MYLSFYSNYTVNYFHHKSYFSIFLLCVLRHKFHNYMPVLLSKKVSIVMNITIMVLNSFFHFLWMYSLCISSGASIHCRLSLGLPQSSQVALVEPSCQYRRHKRHWFDPWVRKIPWRRAWHPLQYSCLENPMDGRARWATGRGVAKSRTRLKQLSMGMGYGLPSWHNGKESAYQCRRRKWCGFNPWVKKIPGSRKWLPTQVLSGNRGAWWATVHGVANN